MRGSCCRSRPACRRGRQSSWWPQCSMLARCCSAASAACCGSSFPAVTWKREGKMRGFCAFLIALAVSLVATPLEAQDRLNVVASFSILSDFVREVGGERVDVTTLVPANGDVHVYTPAPQDAKKIADARLVVINGLGLEGWMPRLLQSSGSKAPIVVATNGITPLKLGSEADPHAWQSVENAKVYVKNIRDALIQTDAADAKDFRRNADRYLSELDALEAEVQSEIEKIAPERRKVISTHGAFGYFARSYG